MAIGAVSLAGALGLHKPGYPEALGVMAAFAITIWSTRKTLEAGNLVNRRIIDGIAATCIAIAIAFALGWVAAVPFTAGLAISMLIAAATTSMMAIFVERGLALTSLGFLATSALVLLLPALRGLILALGCLASFGAAAWVWRRLQGAPPRLPRSVRSTDLHRAERTRR